MQKENRLTRREDFNKVYRHGKSSANHQFVVYIMPQSAAVPGESFRLGVSVSKKVGNAVVRNRIRRLVKEIVRHNGEKIAPRTDMILIARKPAAEMEYAEMEKSVLHVLKRAGILGKKG
ncbi:ribonuclease P protein component [Gorillibacterium sp. sgz5001074]|uniref:ribonuclease P protein component n=1 Tax=Gorillibacterium sp. sgz5001074 TaxID=3446695 RepID=UPI003F675588